MLPVKRQQEILKFLKNAPQRILSAKELAGKLVVSSKTIRNDIKQINEEQEKTIIESMPGKGYHLAFSEFKLDLVEKEDLRFTLLYKIIEEQTINYFNLADSLYVSETTLDRLISELNAVIKNQDSELTIQRKNNYVFINGEEEEKRKLFNIFLNQEIETNQLSLDKYSNYFTSCDLNRLSTLILKFHNKYNISMNDFSAISFVLHIAVLVERISSGSTLPDSDKQIDENDFNDRMAVLLSRLLEKELHVSIPSGELLYIRRLYNGSLGKKVKYEEAYLSEIVDESLAQVNQMYGIDFSSDLQFKDSLTMHLSGLYLRGMSGRYLTNPLVGEMKSKFPFIYNISVYASSFFQEKLSIYFPDDEIAYIALHFLSASKTLSMGKKKRVLVVCPYGLASQRIIEDKLSKTRNFSVEIVQFVSVLEFSVSAIPEIDLIITSEELSRKTNLPTFQYNSFLTDNDIVEIERIFDRQMREPTVFDTFFKKELFFSQLKFNNREEVIRFLCSELVEKNYCETDYCQQVLERENLSSTSYGNFFAIPHAIKRCAKKNVVSVCCLEKAIDWGGKKVKLVLLLSLKEERQEAFEELFVQLVNMLNETSFVKKLSNQRSFEAFIELCQTAVVVE